VRGPKILAGSLIRVVKDTKAWITGPGLQMRSVQAGEIAVVLRMTTPGIYECLWRDLTMQIHMASIEAIP
jgi:hypothetical protein